jgi:hypothetical protein
MSAKRRLPYRFKRFSEWLRQAILLGRVDWRKASDDASPPRLSRQERDELRPQFDVNVIKPRSVKAAERAPEPAAPSVRPPIPPETAPADASQNSAPRPPKSRVFRRHHHERTSQIAVNPLSAFSPDKLPASRLERLFEKFFGRRG